MGLQRPRPVPGKGQDAPARTGRREAAVTALPAHAGAGAVGGRAASRDYRGEQAAPEFLCPSDAETAWRRPARSSLPTASAPRKENPE